MLNSMSSHPSNECARCNCSLFGPTAGHINMSHDASMGPLLVDRWLLQHLPSDCWGDRSVQFGEDCPIITSSSMTLMEFLSPQKMPQNSSRSRVHHRGAPNQKTSKMASSKKASTISFVGHSVFFRGEKIYLPKKNLFTDPFRNCCGKLEYPKSLSATFVPATFSDTHFSGGKHILATVPVGESYPEGALSRCFTNSREAWKYQAFLDMYGYVVWFFPKFSHYNFYHQQVFVKKDRSFTSFPPPETPRHSFLRLFTLATWHDGIFRVIPEP